MRFKLPLLLMCLATAACKAPAVKKSLGDFYNYKLYEMGITLTDNQAIRSDKKIYFLPKDSTDYQFIAEDTGHIEFEIWDLNKKQIIQTEWVNIKQHPLYKPEWESDGFLKEGVKEPEYQVFVKWRKCEQLRTNESFPEFQMIDVWGKSISNEDFKNKTTVVNMWYFGCLPCMGEIPYLNKLKEEFKNDTTVQFISFFKDSISIAENILIYSTSGIYTLPHQTPEELNKSLMKEGFDYRQIPNSADFLETNQLRAFPQNFVVNKSGKIIYQTIGASIDENTALITQLRKQIKLASCVNL